MACKILITCSFEEEKNYSLMWAVKSSTWKCLNIDEDDETVVVDVESVTNGFEDTEQQLTFTIIDDDDAPTVKLSADTLINALSKTFEQKKVTYDFARQMKDATLLKCSEFGDEIISNMQ